VALLAIGCAAPSEVAAYEGPYSRAGVYGVFVDVPPPGWTSPYALFEGVPLIWYPPPIGIQRNPVTTAQYGLARWSTGSKYGVAEEIAAAEQVGLWLVHHQQANGEWLYEFPDVIGPGPELTLQPPWASALAQGQAISLLTRLYRHTHEQLYLTAAELALQPLLKPVAEGGLASHYEGGVWLEEAPTAKPIYILNGFLMTIVGLYDLADLDPAAQTLFQETVATAAQALPAFDAGKGSSWYDLVGRYGVEQHTAPPGYGPIIVNTLELLNTLSPHEAFLQYAQAWAAGVQHPTSTHVICSPQTVTASQPSTCTATVTGTATSEHTAPTGAVSFQASPGPGTFSTGPSCILSAEDSNSANCSVTYAPAPTPATPERGETITATYGGDHEHEDSKGTAAVTVISPTVLAYGSFVIGDENASVGSNVNWRTSKWSQLNQLSVGPAPRAFKGFAESSSSPPRCQETWTTKLQAGRTSSGPPATVPEYMEVISASKITKSGSTIFGNAPEVVVVKTNSGFGPTGTVVAVVCKS
jgi:hypothetical protein